LIDVPSDHRKITRVVYDKELTSTAKRRSQEREKSNLECKEVAERQGTLVPDPMFLSASNQMEYLWRIECDTFLIARFVTRFSIENVGMQFARVFTYHTGKVEPAAQVSGDLFKKA
jgi:hypothetical protein